LSYLVSAYIGDETNYLFLKTAADVLGVTLAKQEIDKTGHNEGIYNSFKKPGGVSKYSKIKIETEPPRQEIQPAKKRGCLII
jgi:hypothetical protein